MSCKAVAWTLLAAVAFTALVLFNYWASYQPLSSLAYAGIVLALFGLLNLAIPFRLLGIRKRAVGAPVLAGGVGLTLTALSWPAPLIRAAEHRSVLDEIMPQYQFFERHSARVHAPPELVMQAVRESTFGDLKSLVTLLKIRGAALREPFHDNGGLQEKRVFDAFSESGSLSGGSEHEIVIAWSWNARANRRPEMRTLEEFADYGEAGAVKMAFNFNVEDAGGGWSTVSTETRVLALGDVTSRGMGRYWRLIVPGSGLLRREWLDGIKKRAESMPEIRS